MRGEGGEGEEGGKVLSILRAVEEAVPVFCLGEAAPIEQSVEDSQVPTLVVSHCLQPGLSLALQFKYCCSDLAKQPSPLCSRSRMGQIYKNGQHVYLEKRTNERDCRSTLSLNCIRIISTAFTVKEDV